MPEGLKARGRDLKGCWKDLEGQWEGRLYNSKCRVRDPGFVWLGMVYFQASNQNAGYPIWYCTQ